MRHLKNWHSLSFRSIQGQIDDTQSQLQRVQSFLHQSGQPDKEMELRQQLDGLLEKQELYWAQRLKQMWMKPGERNNRFFSSNGFLEEN